MGISQEPLALLTGAPEPAPAIPTMGSFPTSACQLGHPQLLQSAEGTDSSELFFRERKTTSKSGQKYKGRAQWVPPQGGHKGKAGGTVELVQEQTSPLQRAVCRDLF